MIQRNLLAVLFILSFLSIHSSSVLVNVSIDDTLGDERTGNMITYVGGWKVGQSCTDCTTNVNARQTFEFTWHDATFHPTTDAIISASVSFNGTSLFEYLYCYRLMVSITGTAVYVVCILLHSTPSFYGNTDMVFFIDNAQVGSLEQSPDDPISVYQYNQTVFSQTGLTPTTHNISIQVGNNGTKAIILLDRIIYT